MRRIIRLNENDLSRIVRRVISEGNEPSFMQSIKNLYRDFIEGGDIDYDYIENKMKPKELADLIYGSLYNFGLNSVDLDRGRRDTGSGQNPFPKDYSSPDYEIAGDAEAPVEAAFLNMSKPLKKEGYCPECWKKYTEVSNLYKQRFNRYMLKDVKDKIDIHRKYHKKSINSIIKSWGGS